MNEDEQAQGNGNGAGEAAQSPLQRVVRLLASLRFAVLLVALLTAACIVGTLLPQGGQVARYLEQHPEGAARMKVLSTLGLTHVFSAWWFVGLLALLAASLCVCIYRRWLVVLRRRGPARYRALGSTVTHISLLFILVGGVLRVVWGNKGTLAMQEGQTATTFSQNQQPVDLPFAIRLVDFELEFYGTSPEDGAPADNGEWGRLGILWPGANEPEWMPAARDAERDITPPDAADDASGYHVQITRYVPDFIIDMTTRDVRTRSKVANNPAIQVTITSPAGTNVHWLFARFPDFNMHDGDEAGTTPPFALSYAIGDASRLQAAAGRQIKDYKSSLQILEGSRVVKEKTIEVNDPLRYRGYSFYQLSYNPNDLTWTVLQVVKDPGVWAVYTGFTFLIVGLAIVFYIFPKRLGQTDEPGADDDYDDRL